MPPRTSALPLGPGATWDGDAPAGSAGGAIAWSYDLLTPSEQALFRRLAVFVGGFTLEAAEAICVDPGLGVENVLDGVTALVNHNLIRREADQSGGDGEPRFGMYETIREFALELLMASGEASALHRPYSRYFLVLAERLAACLEPLASWAIGPPYRRTSSATRALAALARDHDNLRTALAWAAADSGDGGEAALRLAAALWRPWQEHGDRTEGRRWLRECEVLCLLARGLSNRQIAAALVVTERTAKTHVEHILSKLGVRSRAQVVAWAAERGMLAERVR